MDIYDSIGAKGYEIFNCETYEDGQVVGNLDGTPRKAEWRPILVKRGRGSRRQGCRPADLPYLFSAFVLRRSAVDALRDMLETHGELLPLATDDGIELYVLNVRAIDALDEPRSKINYVESTGQIGYVDKPFFIRSVLEGVDIFTLRCCLGEVYFSDRFVARVKAAKLKGLDFTKVWSSDESA